METDIVTRMNFVLVIFCVVFSMFILVYAKLRNKTKR